MGFTFISTDPPSCTITLSPAFTNYNFDSLKYNCILYNSSNGAPGSIVYGTSGVNNMSIIDGYGYGSGGWQGNAQCAGGNPPWWCFHFKSLNNLMGTMWMILIFVAISIGLITLTYWVSGKTSSIEKDVKLQDAAIRSRLRTAIIKKMQEEKSTEKLAALRQHADMLGLELQFAKTHSATAAAVPSTSS